MSLGSNISRLRAEKHLSQGDLAEALDVSRQSVSKWETDGSVPDLDKLVKLSRIFGVTLDELVTGTPPENSSDDTTAPAAPTIQPPATGNLPGRKVAGIVLLCMAFVTVLVCTVAGGLLEGLILCTPFLSCGVICFLAKKRPGLWCAWAVYLLVEVYLRWATGITWQLTLFTLSFTPDQNYIRLLIAWIQLIVMLVMFLVTIRAFRRVRVEPRGRNVVCLICGWAALILLNALKNRLDTHLYQIPEFSFSLGLRLLPQAVDVLFLVFFTALLTVTVCTIRTRIADTKGTP